jgi:hypothetical protein
MCERIEHSCMGHIQESCAGCITIFFNGLIEHANGEKEYKRIVLVVILQF